MLAPWRPERPSSARPTDVRVRRAVLADDEDLARIGAERHRVRPAAMLPWARRLLGRGRDRPDRWLLLVAEAGDRVVGYGLATVFVPETGAPHDVAPAGHYLLGLVVEPVWRRRGIGRALVAERLGWIAARAQDAYYFCDLSNHATIALHAPWGFAEVTRDFWFPGMDPRDGVACGLFHARVSGSAR